MVAKSRDIAMAGSDLYWANKGTIHRVTLGDRVDKVLLDRIVRANASRIQGDFRERLRESRRRMQAEIKTLLCSVSATPERALGRARVRQAAGVAAVEADLARIDRLHLRLRLETEAFMPPQSGKDPLP
jgi:hypothetical protein